MDHIDRPRSWLTRPRIVGTPARWSSQAGLFGLLIGGLGTFALTASPSLLGGWWGALLPALALSVGPAVVGLVGGATIGLFVPSVLDRLRGRVPLPIVAGAAGIPGAAIGAVAGYAWWMSLLNVFVALEIDLAATCTAIGAAVGLVAALVWWLPFTVATVLGRSWPVTVGAGVGLPLALVLGMAALIL